MNISVLLRISFIKNIIKNKSNVFGTESLDRPERIKSVWGPEDNKGRAINSPLYRQPVPHLPLKPQETTRKRMYGRVNLFNPSCRFLLAIKQTKKEFFSPQQDPVSDSHTISDERPQ